jgi:hypothetical protein
MATMKASYFYNLGLKEKVKRLYKRWIRSNDPKIFCISMQRTGTTSVGDFFKSFGFTVAGWNTSNKNKWTYLWYKGDYESILNSFDFKCHQVFEDDPWWCPEFYKLLFHRFPKAKFVLFTRDSDRWFSSMMKHSRGKSLGNTRIHSKIYRREKEFYHLADNLDNFLPSDDGIDNLLDLEGMADHYKSIYEIRNREVISFFSKYSPNSLFVGHLEDPEKWKKLGSFFGIDVPEGFEVHANKSKSS